MAGLRDDDIEQYGGIGEGIQPDLTQEALRNLYGEEMEETQEDPYDIDQREVLNGLRRI